MPKVVDGAERREFLAKIAAELIADEGLERATVREIAKRAGATRGLVAYHFRNKHEMIEMALDAINRRYTQREQRQLRGKRGLDALEARLLCLLPLSRESNKEWRLRLRFWSANDQALRKIQRKRLAETRRLFRLSLQQAVEDQALAISTDIDTLAKRLHASVAGLSAIAVVDSSSFSSQHLKAELKHLMLKLRSQQL